MNPEWELVPVDSWRVVDKWWTDKPVNRSFMTVRAPDGTTVCLSWDASTKEWQAQMDPRTEITVTP